MKNVIKLIFATAILISFGLSSTIAQTVSNDNSKSSVVLSVGADAGIPVGNMRNRYNWNFGGSVQIDIPIVANSLSLIGSAGFNNFFSKNDLVNSSDLQMIPVKAGLKYFFVPDLYIQGQAGVSFLIDKDKGGYDKSAVFSYAPQIGYQFPVGNNYIDAGIRWEGNSKFSDHSGSNNFWGLRVAYAFGL